jgi:hypothetical protein
MYVYIYIYACCDTSERIKYINKSIEFLVYCIKFVRRRHRLCFYWMLPKCCRSLINKRCTFFLSQVRPLNVGALHLFFAPWGFNSTCFPPILTSWNFRPILLAVIYVVDCMFLSYFSEQKHQECAVISLHVVHFFSSRFLHENHQ